jgi:hypothetical protein
MQFNGVRRKINIHIKVSVYVATYLGYGRFVLIRYLSTVRPHAELLKVPRTIDS